MAITNIRLLELMSSRMFHDLAGPIGAISNGLEFLEEEEFVRNKAISLIKLSSHEAVIRLKFFRQAYGTIGDSEVFFSSINYLISDFNSLTKVKLFWEIPENSINSYLAKIVLNLTIICLNSLIQGGNLFFSQENNVIKVKLVGDNIIFSDETKLLLMGDVKSNQLTSANVQIYYTYLMFEKANAKLDIIKSPGQIELLVSY